MCGRFTLTRKKEDIIKEYQQRFKQEIIDISQKSHEENYNITPAQDVAVIYRHGNQLYFDYHKWGLIPSWSKDKKIGNKLINARIETITEKPSFRDSFFRSRCLIIADGYYEWLKRGREKIPYYFLLADHRLFAFAGIRAIWQKDRELIKSCSIITTNATPKIAPIHNRTPIILTPKAELDWITPEFREKNQLFNILANNLNNDLSFYQVTSKVNNPSNNTKNLISREDKEFNLFTDFTDKVMI